MAKESQARSVSGRPYWQGHLNSLKQSGLSRAGYARQAGISYHALTYWKRKFERESKIADATPLVVQVPFQALADAVQEKRSPADTGAFHLHFKDYCLEIPNDFVESSLMRLLCCLGF